MKHVLWNCILCRPIFIISKVIKVVCTVSFGYFFLCNSIIRYITLYVDYDRLLLLQEFVLFWNWNIGGYYRFFFLSVTKLMEVGMQDMFQLKLLEEAVVNYQLVWNITFLSCANSLVYIVPVLYCVFFVLNCRSR